MASNEDPFRYTSGRWLNDEQRHQALRYQRFNIDALKSVVASSARASGVTDIRKLAEGRCNKVFHIQLTEGAQVIARIPTPLSGRPHLVTANEVATMEFLRNRLGLTQVPRSYLGRPGQKTRLLEPSISSWTLRMALNFIQFGISCR